ncbi:MAG: hypothetical protein PHH23_01535 [Paludibacteraceae bacterium]|nr:hypothetical protein [Paludibacteraceae bacterium]
MKGIILKEMKLTNFKGVSSLECQFNACSASVRGKNGSGKSTLYDAYLWCLFGKNYAGLNINVQPLTETNEIVHKVNTEVELKLLVDGKEVTVKRTQKEQWSVPRGKHEEEFKGNVQDRFYNDVPCGVSEFNEKLSAICNVDDWFMLSSVSAFIGLKQEDRRRKLTAIAGEVSDMEIAKDYPHIIESLNSGKTIDELRRQNKLALSKSKIELDEIPSRIDQQEKLRVTDVDYDALLKRNESVNSEIASIDLKLQSKDDGGSMKELVAKKSRIISDLSDIETSLSNERQKKYQSISNELSDLKVRASRIEHEKAELIEENEKFRKRNEVLKVDFNGLSVRWTEENSREYKMDFDTACPTCGRPYDEETTAEFKEQSVNRFNERKLSKLKDIENDALAVKKNIAGNNERISVNEKKLSEIETVPQSKLSELELKLSEVPTVECAKAAHSEYQKLSAELQSVESEIKSYVLPQVDSSLLSRKSELQAELSANIGKLATKETNKRIDALLAELQERSKSLSQSIANLDQVEFEIQAFKKAKISIVEEKVSALFDIVKWKMYEPNITNDGEKEICQAIIDGKPYESQNTAMKVNAGIDIINGLSVASEVSVPLFIDNKESVTNIIESASQIIALEVSDCDLTIN